MVINSNLSAANSQTDFASLAKSPAKFNGSQDTSASLASQLIAVETQNTNQTQSDSASDLLAMVSENLAAANPINDSQTADQVTSALSSGLLNQPNLALLAQGNQLPQSVLSLLQP